MERGKPEKHHVRTLTTGWRFTVPAQVRKTLGWDQGTPLRATATNDRLVLSRLEDVPLQASGDTGDNDAIICHLGSGGKIVVPVEVREKVGWQIGERLSVRNEPEGIVISACCQKNRCRSCGSLHNVTEVIKNLYLCSDCWSKYLLEN
ncbi:MAG: AbrB/MazE/SpoVT family DNA-binding domain-containing protein [Bacillota bacterium]